MWGKTIRQAPEPIELTDGNHHVATAATSQMPQRLNRRTSRSGYTRSHPGEGAA
jgi:hypothetical protein